MEQASHRQVERTGHCITIISISTSMIDSAINFSFNISQCNQFQHLSPMLHTSRWNNRNKWRNMERRLHGLEGRSTQGRCRQEGEARLRQGISWLFKGKDGSVVLWHGVKRWQIIFLVHFLIHFQVTSSPSATTWDDVDCSNTMPAFACQKPLIWSVFWVEPTRGLAK